MHLFGRPADMAAIREIADAHGLRVLEDAAQAFGATQGGRRIGGLGDAAAFSFFPTKNLGAFGDAGLIATDDDAVAEQARMLRVHGSRERYHHEALGYNSRLDALQAAVLRVKLPHVDAWNERRRAVAARYGHLLRGVEGVRAPAVTDGHVFHQYTVRVTGAERDAVRARMQEQGVGTMIYYPIPQDRLPMYADGAGDCPHSDAAAEQVLSLPMWPSITEAQAAQVLSLPMWPSITEAQQVRVVEAVAAALGAA